MRRKKPATRLWKSSDSGFTLIELIVGTILTAVLVAATYAFYIHYNRVVIVEDDRVEVSQIARSAIGKVKSDIMVAGRNARIDNGQEAMVYAAPWEMVFNADVSSMYGALSTSITYGPSSTAYNGNSAWESDAETIHYFMKVPSAGEDFSFSPYDREIRRRINDMRDQNSNLISERVAYGIRYDDGTMQYANSERVPLLFSYWGDFDLNPSTADTLWGDSNGDGVIDKDEINALLTGSYTWSYASQSGTITNSGVPAGAIFIGPSMTNTEDGDGDGRLDPGEDLNGNGRLDTNLLDLAINRIEINLTTISQYLDNKYSHPNESTYHYREYHVKTDVRPRNLIKAPLTDDCGGPPGPPSNVALNLLDCGRRIQVSFNASTDDGTGENDVMWYEIQRKVASGNWEYYTFIPATGDPSYIFIDSNLEKDINGHIVNQTYQYRVLAVDCADQKSAWATSSSVTPVQNFPSAPQIFYSWDSPCYKAVGYPDLGSITLIWEASMSGGAMDTDVDEYWVYRSDPEDLGIVSEEPIAKIPISEADSCASGQGTRRDAHEACVDEQFFDYTLSGGSPYYAWRDEVDSPGRDLVSIIPYNGHQWAINGNLMRYYYEVRAYGSSFGAECLSDPMTLEPLCEDDEYCDSQSYINEMITDTTARSRFAPPLDLEVLDASIIDVNGVVEPRFVVSWNESPSEWCEPPADAQVPDVVRYLVYRTKTFLGLVGGIYRSKFLHPMSACELDWPDTHNDVLAFAGELASGSQSTYSFTDDSVYYNDPVNFPTHTAYNLSAMDDLRPVLSGISPPVLQYAEDNVYEYMVVATNSAWSSGGEPWSFGTSCVVRGKFECVGSCYAHVDASVAEQCALRSDTNDDGIHVFWTYTVGNDPPAGSIVHLVARDEEDPSAPWELVDDNPQWNGSRSMYEGVHGYDDGEICDDVSTPDPECVGQRPPTLWEYALKVQCADPGGELQECIRYATLDLHVPAGLPDPLEVCFYPDNVACDSGATFDCTTGLFAFDFTETLARCPSSINTDKKYTWFRVVRWSKPPSTDASPWSWCPPTWGGNPANCDRPNEEIADAIYYIRADGTSPTPWVGTPPSPRYYAFPGFQDLGGREYRFSEYVNPNLDYWYMIENRMDHNSASGTTNPPRCCPGHSQYGASCPGGYNGKDTCNGGFPENVISYEEIQCYPTFTQGASMNGTADYERFTGWTGDIEGSGASSTPWMNWEWVIFDWWFWGIHFYLGDHAFKYANSRIETDLDNLFGSMLNWLFEWADDLAFAICDWCLEIIITIFCVDWFWTDCYDDLIYLVNHNYLWSNFTAGQCGSSPGPGSPNTNYMYGDLLYHFSFKARYKNKKLYSTVRGQYDPAEDGFNHYTIKIDFDRGGTTIKYSIGYKQKADYIEYVAYNYVASTNDLDDDWWTSLVLVCTNHVTGSADYNHTFVYLWTKPDGSGSQPTDWDWQRGTGGEWFYPYNYNGQAAGLEPVVSMSTVGKTAPGGGNLVDVENKTGKVGFWSDPFVDWRLDQSYFDNIRVTEYCGQCPPTFVTPSKARGMEMPPGWVGDSGLWWEVHHK